jgi:hypothetical protein
MTDDIQQLIDAISKTGRDHPSHPDLAQVEPLRHFLRADGTLDHSHLDDRDGACTRREILARFLVLNAVIDQGPEMTGVRMLLTRVTNQLYRNEVRFLHKPLAFFEALHIAIDQILEQHQSIKAIRATIWATENQTNPEKYNLYMDNSTQTLSYAVFRWGVPIALPLLLDRRAPDPADRATVLLDYLEQWKSAEEMSDQLKCHDRYGLGKAIGDKACHLFAKWVVSSFRLSRRREPAWGDFSFEVPYDSNAGRVLWRTGYFLRWASLEEYRKWEVIQPGRGKEGTNYIRVTNIRERPASRPLSPAIRTLYDDIAVAHLRTHTRLPRKVEIQRIQHAYLMAGFGANRLTVAHFDDGLMHIGTTFCLNHDRPRCAECPINTLCEGHQSNSQLILDYRT